MLLNFDISRFECIDIFKAGNTCQYNVTLVSNTMKSCGTEWRFSVYNKALTDTNHTYNNISDTFVIFCFISGGKCRTQILQSVSGDHTDRPTEIHGNRMVAMAVLCA